MLQLNSVKTRYSAIDWGVSPGTGLLLKGSRAVWKTRAGETSPQGLLTSWRWDNPWGHCLAGVIVQEGMQEAGWLSVLPQAGIHGKKQLQEGEDTAMKSYLCQISVKNRKEIWIYEASFGGFFFSTGKKKIPNFTQHVSH